MLVQAKICGIRRKEDVEFLNLYMPGYAGFIFTESKRRVSVTEARELMACLSGHIKTVGVFVNSNPADIIYTACLLRLDAIQLHGDETPEYINELKKQLCGNTEVWKAVRVKDLSSFKGIGLFGADRIVLDTYRENAYGGIGEPFDWSLATGLDGISLVLAGGLDAGNVEEGIRLFRPGIVDVSSGVETDGYKDGTKIRQFLKKVRRI